MAGAAELLRRAGGARRVRAAIRRAVGVVLRAHEVRDGTISVTLVGDEEIAELNGRYLKHEGVTDVLAFALYENGEPVTGDVYVGLEQALRQAEEAEVAPLEEVVRLAVHGTLHVLGYDHPDGPGRKRSRMWKAQERFVAEAMTS
jgi:probable rRNA maturation factor